MFVLYYFVFYSFCVFLNIFYLFIYLFLCFTILFTLFTFFYMNFLHIYLFVCVSLIKHTSKILSFKRQTVFPQLCSRTAAQNASKKSFNYQSLHESHHKDININSHCSRTRFTGEIQKVKNISSLNCLFLRTRGIYTINVTYFSWCNKNAVSPWRQKSQII